MGQWHFFYILFSFLYQIIYGFAVCLPHCVSLAVALRNVHLENVNAASVLIFSVLFARNFQTSWYLPESSIVVLVVKPQ